MTISMNRALLGFTTLVSMACGPEDRSTSRSTDPLVSLEPAKELSLCLRLVSDQDQEEAQDCSAFLGVVEPVAGPLGVVLPDVLEAKNLPIRIGIDLDDDGQLKEEEQVAYIEKPPTSATLWLEVDRERLHTGALRHLRVEVEQSQKDKRNFWMAALPWPGRVAPILMTSGTLAQPDEKPILEVEPGLHHIVQFARIPNDDEEKAWAREGLVLLGYLPYRSYWARVSELVSEKLLDLVFSGGIVFIRPVTPSMKVHPSLAARDPDEEVQAAVFHFADARESERYALVGAMADLDPNDRLGPSYTIVRGSRARLVALAALEAVQWIEPYSDEVRLHSRAGNIDHHIVPLRASSYSLDGSTINVAVFDAGWVDDTHPDLRFRVSHDPTLIGARGRPVGDYTVVHSHATHMAGVIASSGVGNPEAEGSAPAAGIVSYLAAYSYADIDDLVASEAARHDFHIANHSYGSGIPCSPSTIEPCRSDPQWTSYIQHAREADTWTTEAGVLSIYSAGNDGLAKQSLGVIGWESDNWSTIYSGGAAKNVIATCAASFSPYGGVDYFVRLDSSKGPASDGRIKPDVCADGGHSVNGLAWTTHPGGGYETTEATSAAAAQMSGVAALIAQHFRRTWSWTYPIPRVASIDPALVRGLVIHTALDMTESNSGRWYNRLFTAHATEGPDYTTGWGYVDAQAAVDALRELRYRFGSVAAGETRELEVDVPAGGSFKVTLVWTDPPASLGAAPALVNDLDLRLVHRATGRAFFPWRLDPRSPMMSATHGINVVDNVEQVVLSGSFPSGVYRIVVQGRMVPRGPQMFVVVADAVPDF